MHKLIIGLIMVLFSGVLNGQSKEVPPYFSKPLDIPIILSGSFGELRSNHFHAGLDIKTQQREGLPVYAAADGFIERIKVAHYGYGKALYIKHPNGQSTVYAHLQNYAGDIQDFVKRSQYRKESFPIELFPEKEQLMVKQGDLIGYSGNTGGSGGPHLHFEIRDSSSRPMNPMDYGMEIPDSRPPLINSLIAYPLSDTAHINNFTKAVKIPLSRQSNGHYIAKKVLAAGEIGFGISAYDQQDGASNKNGLYRVVTTVNGTELFVIKFDRFSFSETRYLNQYVDYGYWKKNRSRVQKLFRENDNPLSLLKTQGSDGTLFMEPGITQMLKIVCSDKAGNEVIIDVPIEHQAGKELTINRESKQGELIIANQGTALTKGKFSLYFPSGSLYKNAILDIRSSGDTLVMDRDIIPVHKNITISMDVSAYAEEERSRLYLGRLSASGRPYYQSTTLDGDKITIKTRTLGTYILARDESPPKVQAINFKDGQWMSKNRYLTLKITDRASGIGSYRATINGNFALMEYDYKKNRLTYDFQDSVSDQEEQNLQIEVVDNVGNSTIFEATIYRKQQ